MASAWINGQLVDEDTAAVSIRDTGLLHAAGVFTTMRARGGNVIRLGQHLLRIRGSCQKLDIALPYDDAELAAAVAELLHKTPLPDARLRLTVTRGASPDASHATALPGSVFLIAREFQPYPRELYVRGMTVVFCDEQKLNPYDIQAGHKTLNYLSRLAGLAQAKRGGADEALWESVHDFVESASVSNVFLVKAGRLLTPPTESELIRDEPQAGARLPSCVLPGITRGQVIELAERMGITAQVSRIRRGTLLQADECFLTNSLMGIMPVCRVGDRPVGRGEPGELTTQLTRMYAMATGG